MNDFPNITSALGKTITKVWLDDEDVLHIVFTDGSELTLKDNGQACCEDRYMRTDDILDEYVGGQLLGVEIKEVPPLVGFWEDNTGEGIHDVQFLEIITSKGSFVMSSHNEHNGFYGGFDIYAEYEQ